MTKYKRDDEESLYCRAFRLLCDIRRDENKLKLAIRMLAKIALLPRD